MKKPNVLVLLSEQHRGDCLSCAGHSVVRTPHLDRLAAEGTRFSHAYTTTGPGGTVETESLVTDRWKKL